MINTLKCMFYPKKKLLKRIEDLEHDNENLKHSYKNMKDEIESIKKSCEIVKQDMEGIKKYNQEVIDNINNMFSGFYEEKPSSEEKRVKEQEAKYSEMSDVFDWS